MKKRSRSLSPIVSLHYLKLILRSVLFISAAVMYTGKIKISYEIFPSHKNEHWLLAVIWLFYAVEMALRFFPSKLESMGSQKQFKRYCQPTDETQPLLQSWKRTFAVAAAWIMLNGIFGILYYLRVIDTGILILLSLAYGVCDMICILFFCPFQRWFMKNRCCTTCRIYNWDYAMMFTPLVFIPHAYTWSLLAMSLILLARWEVTVRKHPERFSEKTNASLSCENCKEKMCYHKKQLKSFCDKTKSK